MMKKIYIKPQVDVIKIENVQAFSASSISGQPDHADSRRFDYDKSFDDNEVLESVEWRNDVGFQNKGNFWD